MKIQSYIILLFGCGFLFNACVETDLSPPQEENIYGFWRLQSGVFVTSSDEPIEINPLAYLVLKEDLDASGFSSRNTMEGDFFFDTTGKFSLDIQNITRVADSPWSALFIEKTGKIDRYELEENELRLIEVETEEILRFSKVSETTCKAAINDRTAFLNEASDEFDLKDVKLVNGCLEVYVAYGGGCEDIQLKLVSGEDYAESLPPQLSIRLIMDDDDNCEAYIHERFYFDLKALQYDDLDELILNLEGWEERIKVSY